MVGVIRRIYRGWYRILANGTEQWRRVAPQLTVVSAPTLNKAFERMRGTPTLLGWCPTRRRYVIRQQFSDTPAMIGDASSHCRCGLATGLGQTRVRCAEVRDRPDHIHALLQGQR